MPIYLEKYYQAGEIAIITEPIKLGIRSAFILLILVPFATPALGADDDDSEFEDELAHEGADFPDLVHNDETGES